MAENSKKILVVDDQESIQKALYHMLSSEGYEISTANNGQEALDSINQNSFDLVISDINMPIMNGLELLKNMKANKINIPLLFITSSDKDETLNEAVKFGINGIIEKPFNMLSTLEIIREKIK